jgi:dolichyl-phosphate-mannose-protein mannosyltransferase
LVWALVSWLVVRAIHLDDERLLALAGIVLGVGLLNKPLPAFLAVGILAGVVISGPRRLLRSRWAWAGAAIALLIWSPWIAWQAAHSWPQIDVSRSIAAGNSTSSQPWWAVVPFQVLVVGPPLAVFWIAGLIRLGREPTLRDYRFFAWAWGLLAIVFMATGGKPYYLAGFMPVLIGAGAAAVDGWLRRGRVAVRVAVLGVVFVVSAFAGALISLPIVPADKADGVVGVNPDVGETIGWPELVRTVAGAYDDLPHKTQAVIFTSNYGEAGAVDRFGPALGLPEAFSGHNAFGYWGPPPDGAAPVLVIGLGRRYLQSRFRDCIEVAHIHDPQGVDNDENGAAVTTCASPRRPWSREWPELRHLG